MDHMVATATDPDSTTKSTTPLTEMGATMAVDMDSTEEGDRFRGLCIVVRSYLGIKNKNRFKQSIQLTLRLQIYILFRRSGQASEFTLIFVP